MIIIDDPTLDQKGPTKEDTVRWFSEVVPLRMHKAKGVKIICVMSKLFSENTPKT